ncbi:MAG: hypothetical protein OEY67_07530 [Gammaproteobacteria bacterium]|nr:hypothetical protein [Gammaproteobacteria bacterium]
MKNIVFGLSLLSILLSQPVLAVIDSDASEIQLRKNCNAGGVQLDNCFTSLVDTLEWLWGIDPAKTHRSPIPSKTDPVIVDIGPGLFYVPTPENAGDVGAFCDQRGFVTFRGAGREHSIISAADGATGYGLAINNCTSLSFQDLTIDTKDTFFGILWTGDGNSSYSNIELIGNGQLWYDLNCTTGNSKHYWTSSKLTAKTNPDTFPIANAYTSTCAETWFFGSEITAIGTRNNAKVIAIDVSSGIVHVYGSNIRALSDPGIATSNIIAVQSFSNLGEVHIHGTGIDAISTDNNNVVALKALSEGNIHASETSYVLKSNGGTKTRVVTDGGVINAPFNWGPRTEPPAIISVSGADTYIETDCLKDQKCSWKPDPLPQNEYPHMMVYRPACTGTGADQGPWYDTVTMECRQ